MVGISSRSAFWAVTILAGLLFILPESEAWSQTAKQADGQSVLPADALLTTPVGGLEKTEATTRILSASGQPFTKALVVVIRKDATETNATQLTMPIATAVRRGDALLASFSLKGATVSGKNPAQVMFLFERSVSPWTKSISQGVAAARSEQNWKRVLIPFTAAEDYQPGEAMVSLRFAFTPQTVEVGGLSVVNFGKTKTASELLALAAEQNPLGTAKVTVRLAETKQTLMGFGGNFCQPRYGATEPMDAVGRYNLDHLHVSHARIGIPLNAWTPEKGIYRDDAQAHAALLQMQEMARRKIPIVGSVWEGPLWMLGGQREQSGRTLAPEKYADCIEAIAQFLKIARDKYGATADYFSFNEPDYGVNFRFTPQQMAAFIRQAGPRFQALGLKTKFLVGDTAGGTQFPDYVRPLLKDKSIAPYLGPLAFHCWDVLSASDTRYAGIAAMGRESGKPIWCTEAGHDAQLWQTPDPWRSWENALRTALAYQKTLRLTDAALMDYWTYQDNYPIVSKDGTTPYPVFSVLQQMEEVCQAGSRVAVSTSDNDELRTLATSGLKAGHFALLLINPIGAGQAVLSGLPPGIAVSMAHSVAAKQKVVSSGRTDREGRLTVTLPARSVTSILSAPSSRK